MIGGSAIITKVCTRCGIEQPLENLNKNAKSKDGLSSWCKKCKKEDYWRSKGMPVPQEIVARDGFKICVRCKRELSLDCFNKNRNNKDGLDKTCKECKASDRKRDKQKIAEYNQKYREAHPDYLRTYREEHKEEVAAYNEAHKARKAAYDAKYMSQPGYKEKKRAYDKVYNAKPENQQRAKEYAKRNAAKISARGKIYRAKNLGKIRQREKDYYNKVVKNNPQLRINRAMSGAINYTIRNKNENHWENLVCFTFEELLEHLEKQFKPGMSWDNFGEWHIDHIIPKGSLEFSSHEDENFHIIWGLYNLRPLWAQENLSRPKDGSDILENTKQEIIKKNLKRRKQYDKDALPS